LEGAGESGCEAGRAGAASLLFADAPKMPKGADENLAVGDGHGRTRLLAVAERVAGRARGFGAGVDEGGVGPRIVDVELAVGIQEGAPGVGPGEAGLPEVLAGLDFKAVGDAVLAHEVAVVADEDGGADALGVALVLVVPKAVGLGDVAAAAGL